MGNFIFAILGLFLFATNPEPADFDQFIRSTIASKTESGNTFVDLLAGSVAADMTKEYTNRKNYYVFSIYTVDLSVLSIFKPDIPKQIKILGIANQFVPLNR
jgi:hypothetical protein